MLQMLTNRSPHSGNGRAQPVATYTHRVAHYLRHRKDFAMHRRQAEWLCFRLLGVIEVHKSRLVPAEQVAEILYAQWIERLNREYDTL